MSKWGDMFDPLHQKLCPCFGAVTSSELLPLALLRWSQTDLSRLNMKWLQRPPILHQTSGHQLQFLACQKSSNLVAETKVMQHHWLQACGPKSSFSHLFQITTSQGFYGQTPITTRLSRRSTFLASAHPLSKGACGEKRIWKLGSF